MDAQEKPHEVFMSTFKKPQKFTMSTFKRGLHIYWRDKLWPIILDLPLAVFVVLLAMLLTIAIPFAIVGIVGIDGGDYAGNQVSNWLERAGGMLWIWFLGYALYRHIMGLGAAEN
jgi:hypothetical protein